MLRLFLIKRTFLKGAPGSFPKLQQQGSPRFCRFFWPCRKAANAVSKFAAPLQGPSREARLEDPNGAATTTKGEKKAFDPNGPKAYGSPRFCSFFLALQEGRKRHFGFHKFFKSCAIRSILAIFMNRFGRGGGGFSNRLLIAFLGNGSQESLPRKAFLGKPRPAGRPARHPAGGQSSRTVVGGARVVSGAEKKAFDRCGPVWPPRSNARDDHLRGRSHPRMTLSPPSPQAKWSQPVLKSNN